MAQTKTKKAKAAKKSPASSSKGKAKAKAPANGASANGAANGAGDGAKAVRDALGSAGEVVSKAKVPLVAGGAAVAGTVGGMVLGASRSGQKVLGVKLPKPKRIKIR
jgi:hypothetical protein